MVNLQQVKLVIWDLDNTLWKGTLSEEGYEVLPEMLQLIRELPEYGIMNSICSKNDYSNAEKVLHELNIWEYFIFPKIEWNPKGMLVRTIIEETGFRPNNVLFVDDEIHNLQEVQFYNQNIHVCLPEKVKDNLHSSLLLAKSDPNHQRLQQYKLLERKNKHKHLVTNEQFLKQSNIYIKLSSNHLDHLDRIHELNNRTNQLNYTKVRITIEELKYLVQNDKYDCGYIHVRDKYGDYGIVGFYALETNRLIHFFFSCRVLNMGIEQWVYRKLGYPKIMVTGAVATPLTTEEKLDWISEDIEPVPTHQSQELNNQSKTSLLLKGGCDLEQLAYYLTYHSVILSNEFNEKARDVKVRFDHSEYLRAIHQLPTKKLHDLASRLPFFEIFETTLFNSCINVVIYSLLADYSSGVYLSKHDSDVRFAYEDFLLDITQERNWNMITELSPGLTREHLSWISSNFEYLGPINEARFESNIKWIRDNLPSDTMLIIINGNTTEVTGNFQIKRHLHHLKMNDVLSSVVNRLHNTLLVDVNRLISSADDTAGYINLFKRKIYKGISDIIIDLISTRFGTVKQIDPVEYRKSLIRDKMFPKSYPEEIF
jgi:FkbH-like protein